MAYGLAAGLAKGLETGYSIGRQGQQDTEARRHTAVEEGFQANQDIRADEQNRRANMDQVLREQAQAASESRANEQTRQQRLTTASTLLGSRNKEISETAAARSRAGMPVDAADAAEYGQNQEALGKIRQEALNFFSRASTGTTNPQELATSDPQQMRLYLTAATGLLPEEIAEMPKHINDMQAAVGSGNSGLAVQAANGLMKAQLRRGIGEESPHGGTILRKEIIGLDPAVDANGQEHPNRVIPRLRIYVDHPNMPGPKLEDGSTGYYDAPMTQGGTSSPDEKVVAIDMTKGFDFMGQMGMLAQSLQDPKMAAVVNGGGSSDKAKKYIDDLTALSRPVPKGATAERLQAIEDYARRNGITPEAAARKMEELGVNAGVGAATVRAKIDEIDAMDIPDDQKASLKRDVVLGAGGRTTGLIKAAAKTDVAPNGAGASSLGPTNANLHGDELLTSLDPSTAVLVKSIAEGKQDLKSVSVRNGRQEQVAALVHQYSTQYDSKAYPTAQATEKAFSSGVEGRKVRSFNVAIDHMDTLVKAAEALKNGDTQGLNRLKNAFNEQFGAEAPTTFDALKRIVADEVVNGVVGNSGALADRDETARSLQRQSSPEQFAGVIAGLQKLMGGQLVGLAKQYQAGGGQKDFASTFLTPRSQELAAQLGLTAKQIGGGRTGGGAPASKYVEGQTATNPTTGAKLIFRGGKWQPVQ